MCHTHMLNHNTIVTLIKMINNPSDCQMLNSHIALSEKCHVLTHIACTRMQMSFLQEID